MHRVLCRVHIWAKNWCQEFLIDPIEVRDHPLHGQQGAGWLWEPCPPICGAGGAYNLSVLASNGNLSVGLVHRVLQHDLPGPGTYEEAAKLKDDRVYSKKGLGVGFASCSKRQSSFGTSSSVPGSECPAPLPTLKCQTFTSVWCVCGV